MRRNARWLLRPTGFRILCVYFFCVSTSIQVSNAVISAASKNTLMFGCIYALLNNGVGSINI